MAITRCGVTEMQLLDAESRGRHGVGGVLRGKKYEKALLLSLFLEYPGIVAGGQELHGALPRGCA